MRFKSLKDTILRKMGLTQRDKFDQAIELALNAEDDLLRIKADMRDLRRRTIEIDIESLSKISSREIELRAHLYSRGRGDYHLVERIREEELELSRKREAFIDHVSRAVSFKFYEYLQQGAK